MNFLHGFPKLVLIDPRCDFSEEFVRVTFVSGSILNIRWHYQIILKPKKSRISYNILKDEFVALAEDHDDCVLHSGTALWWQSLSPLHNTYATSPYRIK